MFSKVLSAGIGGIDAYPVRVEADLSDGLPQFIMVGYLGSEVKEAGDRVRTALRNAGCPLPPKRITVNLAPAGVRKAGSRFDLPVAAAVLAAMSKIPAENLNGLMMAGELSLSGQVLSIPGVLSLAQCARQEGVTRCIVPKSNAKEGAVVEGVEMVGVSDIDELIEILRHPGKAQPVKVDIKKLMEGRADTNEGDFSEISGQLPVRRAAEVAAAGLHNFLMMGPPGAGKTMIAKRIPGIMPPPELDECLEITKIYSVAGLLPEDSTLITSRPFRFPHHTATPEALAGGGRNPKPGEVSLSTGGILFLDELPEFQRGALEILRQPLEEGRICISRSAGTYVFPSRFMLVAAMNPCACGYFPDRKRCRCTSRDILRYLGRISQPFLDRIDVCIEVEALPYEEIGNDGVNESSAQIRKRVAAAWEIQSGRYKGMPFSSNSRIDAQLVKRYCVTTDAASATLESAFRRMNLSARAYHRLLRVSRTLADLEGVDTINEGHVLEAIGYRPPDRNEWMKEV